MRRVSWHWSARRNRDPIGSPSVVDLHPRGREVLEEQQLLCLRGTIPRRDCRSISCFLPNPVLHLYEIRPYRALPLIFNHTPTLLTCWPTRGEAKKSGLLRLWLGIRAQNNAHFEREKIAMYFLLQCTLNCNVLYIAMNFLEKHSGKPAATNT